PLFVAAINDPASGIPARAGAGLATHPCGMSIQADHYVDVSGLKLANPLVQIGELVIVVLLNLRPEVAMGTLGPIAGWPMRTPIPNNPKECPFYTGSRQLVCEIHNFVTG